MCVYGIPCSCEWGHSSHCLPPPNCHPSFTKQRGKGGFVSPSLREGRRKAGERKRERERSSKAQRGLWQWCERVRLPSTHCRERVRTCRKPYISEGFWEEERENTALWSSEGKEKTGNQSINVLIALSLSLSLCVLGAKHPHSCQRPSSLDFLLSPPVSEYKAEYGVRGEGQQENGLLGRTATLHCHFFILFDYIFPLLCTFPSPLPPPSLAAPSGSVPQAAWMKCLRIRVLIGENEDRHPRGIRSLGGLWCCCN